MTKTFIKHILSITSYQCPTLKQQSDAFIEECGLEKVHGST